MLTIHEGEIIFKEKYGSTLTQRLYVKPPDQGNIVILNEKKSNDFNNIFTRIFLPQGYPDSVSSDYINYQVWDTAQAFCSTITGILATQEVLRGVGVGDTTATPLAATITWVLKDGCGHLGKIIFAYTHGNYLDAYSKKWRLYADVMNDLAMCIEIALPAFKSYTTLLLCGSTVIKAIVGVAGGATRAAMTQHHAIRANLADVSAKDSAQETAVNLIASITALLIITIFGNSLILFMIMMVFHIFFNYMAVRAVCLKTLNEPRFLKVIDLYLKKEIIANPCDINRMEPLIFFNFGPNILDRQLCGFNINIGHSMDKVVKKNPKAQYMKHIQEIYKYNEYVLIHSIELKRIYILLRDTATSDDVLHAYFHAVLYGIIICAINNYPLPIYKNPENSSRPFTQICETLQQVEWSKDPMESPKNGFTYEPSFELITYIKDIVQKEWPKMCAGLQKIGWDLGKHLLIVDEWRISTVKLIAKRKSLGQMVVPDLSHTAQHTQKASKVFTFGGYCDEQDKNCEKEIKTYIIEPETNGTDNKGQNSEQKSKRQLDHDKVDSASKKQLEQAVSEPSSKTRSNEKADSKMKYRNVPCYSANLR